MDNRIGYIKSKLINNSDFSIRKIEVDLGTVYLLFINTISDTNFISQSIIKPIIEKKDSIKKSSQLKSSIITYTDINNINSLEEALSHILLGDTVLAFSFSEDLFYCETKKVAERSVKAPPSESVLKGPREGFVENIHTNISLIRKRLTSDKLKCEILILGQETLTEVAIIYIEGNAPRRLINHVRKKLIKINNDYIGQAHYVVEHLEEKASVFSTIGNTEQPDDFIAKIYEGRVGILVDGDPFTIIVPHFFIDNFHSPNDYNINQYVANYYRLIRWLGFLISLLFPAIYVALTTHHYSLIPPLFLYRLAVARAGVPFPINLEILLMMFFFQILREASLRLPQSIGQAISIVGALILGDTAVKSGLSSTVAILLVALTSLSAFLVPNIFGSISIWTDIIIIFSSLLGLPGFFIGFLIFLSHIASLTSCGYPYLYPIGTIDSISYKDRVFRSKLKSLSHSFIDEDEKNE